MHSRRIAAAMIALGLSGPSIGADAPAPSDVPHPVAATRAEMKQRLEASKRSTPRLPLPEPTAAESEAAASSGRGRGPMGGIINNGRMRKLYLPPEFVSGGFQRDPDPSMTLPSSLKTMFFWIASRANNCDYCQGHQEVKLLADGIDEDTIAALDGDWSGFAPADRAAFAFTKKLTDHPDTLNDADIDALRPHYNAVQIVEIVHTVAGNNAMNRWTGALAIPQEDHRAYLSTTAEKDRASRSLVAPIAPGLACAAPNDRGPLPDRGATEAAIVAARSRTPRLPIVAGGPGEPAWTRLLANFPKAGKDRVAMHRATEEKGRLDPTLRAGIAWVAARNDRAWYALDLARRRLRALGLTDEAIFALDTSADTSPPATRLALAFARKLTVDPARITDADVAALRRQFDDHRVAEIIFQATEAAYFDRLTEAAALPIEP